MKRPSRLVQGLLILITACSGDGGCGDDTPAEPLSVPTRQTADVCPAPRPEPGLLPEGSAVEERQAFASADNAQSWKVGNGWIQILGGVHTEWKMAHATEKDVRGVKATFGPVADDDGRTVFVLAWKEKTDCGEKSFAVVGALLKSQDYVDVADALNLDSP